MYACMYACIYVLAMGRERDLRGGEGQKERDTKNLMQAPHSAQD